MTAVKAGDVDRAVKTRGPDVVCLLFYGPDTGRVAERAREAAASFVEDPADAFQLVRLDGDALADTPTRLIEEAATFGLFGARRAIWVRPTSRSLAPALAPCLDGALADVLLVIEAGDLGRAAPLRSLCEASPRALALPCYADEARDLGAVITETLAAEGLAIDREAREVLADHLGGDRLASRGELAKLALYARGRPSVTLADVEAVVSDVSGESIDAVIDAAFAGDASALDAALTQATRNGVQAGTILALAARHAWLLLAARARMDDGMTADTALGSWRGLHFRRKASVGGQIRRWATADLRRAVARLQEATGQTRVSAALGDTAVATVLMAIARHRPDR